MFTGIIESMGEAITLKEDKKNLHITIESPISDELKVDQSLSHNGVCLTVVDIQNGQHTVTAVEETLIKSNLQYLQVGDHLNMERAMKIDSRFDGHIVQGHVDQTAECSDIKEDGGSWYFTFQFPDSSKPLMVNKGSISIDGVSLTIVEAGENHFNVAIIPYTYENTSFGYYKVGDKVNIEFDVIGKYLERLYKMS